MTLTVAEIKTLAEFAGLVIQQPVLPLDADGMETEISVESCPKDGVKDEDGKTHHSKHIAYLPEYPEEGVMPL